MGFKIRMDTHIILKQAQARNLPVEEVTIKTKSNYEIQILNQFRSPFFIAKLIQSP